MSKHLLSRQIFALLTVLSLLTIPASARQQLHGHVPEAIAAAPMVGDVADTETLHLAIGLPLRNQDDLQNLIQNLYDSRSPQYHQFLAPEQFAQMFGPTPEDYQKLIDFAQSNGLSVVGTSANHLLLEVSATAADVRRVLHVNLHYYQRPNGTKFRAPDTEPSVDFDLPISHIGGLDTYSERHTNMVIKNMIQTNNFSNTSGAKENPNGGTGPKDTSTGLYTYWGFDFKNIYFPSPCSIQTGTGQNIALFELDDYNSSNIANYESDTHIGSPSLTKVVVNGGFPSPGSGEGEVELDIEMAMSMAPGASIYVYETSGPTNADLEILLNAIANPSNYGSYPLCNQISSSWTWTGAFDASVTATFAQYAVQGQSFFQASGDDGAYVPDDPIPDVFLPIAETSLMTVVGGTSLTTSGSTGASVGTYTSETTWNNPSYKPSSTKTPVTDQYNAVSGGGICNSGTTPLPIPTYQMPFVTMTPGAGSGASPTYRNIPDVAMVADNIAFYTTISPADGGSGTGIYIGGGTSAASPLWAGLMAVINEQAHSQNKGPIGFANYYLYSLPNDFNNISDGSTNNYWGTTPNQYQAVAGYNLTTGLGSPKCNLVADVITPLSTNTITPTPTVTRTPTITPTPTATFTVTNTPTPPTTNTSYAYPQPAHGGQVYLVYNSPIAQQVRINIYSLSGQEVDSVMDTPQASNANRLLISLQGFVPSVYFYVINGLSTGVLAKGKFLVVP
jgi:subtilase family serine protease